MNNSFGNIRKSTLKFAVKNKEFMQNWNITKNQM